jgi:hypothetical protein
LDSLAALAAALGAQREFERVRLNFMPYGGGGSGSGCNEVIGRFCYTYGDRSGKSRPPPRDAFAVQRARADLLKTLDSLVAAADPPGDWLVGTLVRYHLEAGQGDDALRALRDCRASDWWCWALRGAVHHVEMRHTAAEDAFTRARTLMNLHARCEWDDIRWLLSHDAGREYRELTCDDRLKVSRTAWWLAQPLWSEPGNHRRSEHDYRRVMERLSLTGLNPTRLRWDDDMSQIVVRFGWPDYWRRYWNTMGDPNAMSPRITQYTMEPSYHFIPSWRALMAPAAAADSDWVLLPRDSREEYSPDSMSFATLAGQVARFLRGDSLLVAARVDVARDSQFAVGDELKAVVAMAWDPDERPLLFPGVK